MHKLFALLAIGSLGWSNTYAQTPENSTKVTATKDCSDLSVHSKMIDLNKDLEKQGFKMAYFSSGNIPSKSFMSVRLECEAGEKYEIRYVLGANASKYQMNVIDNNINHIVKLKEKTQDSGHTVVSQSFVAKSKGIYVIVYSQTAKTDNCIGLSVFKKK